MTDKEAMIEYWRYVKKEVNPWRKERGFKPINYTQAKALLRKIQALGGKRA